ncbi:MAG: sulfurtransferase-like selenium metabolism protein YedF [Candidatus Tenebribacter davisii]|jgi:selenium metabolism protein YedF|nr:sulfurtransferase-like selenium metabolism protein YedF [Candidatus Tenebribacter davisii]
MKTIDVKGLSCPQPVVLAIREIKDGTESFTIIVDNSAALKNVQMAFKNHKYKFDVKENDGNYILSAKKSGELIKEQNPSSKIGKHIYVFKTNGIAADELGQMLTHSFIANIKEVHPLPDKIVFYHEGVKLVLENSPVLEALIELENLGVELLICGNCLKFYNVEDKVAVGTLSNAFTILQSITDANNLVSL